MWTGREKEQNKDERTDTNKQKPGSAQSQGEEKQQHKQDEGEGEEEEVRESDPPLENPEQPAEVKPETKKQRTSEVKKRPEAKDHANKKKQKG